MDKLTNPMMITVVIRFTGHINFDHLMIDLDGIVKRFRRFRQRIIRPNKIFQRPYWEDDPTFRLEDHVERRDLPLPADEAAVEMLSNQVMNSMLDFTHALWKLTLVENHPDGSILIVRVHHCIADGISLMRVLSLMTHTSNEVAENKASVVDLNPDANQSNQSTVGTQVAVQISPNNPNATPGQGALVRNPTFTEMLAAIARIAFRKADPPTLLKGPLGQVKKAVWSEPFSVAEIKRIAQSKQATINDVVMAVASGAIQRYMDLHKDDLKRNIRAFILVNLRGLSIDDELGNNFGLVFLTLPLDREQPLDRLEGVKQGMDTLKASAEYAATYLILNLLGMLPGWIESIATRFLDTKGTVVATNVPGSRKQLFMANAPIKTMFGWVPQSGRIGVGLSFISYNGELVVGLNVDAGLIPDPDTFITLFTEEYKSFVAVLPPETTIL